MSDSTRIPKAELTGIFGFVVKKVAEKRFGEVPDAVGVMWHNRSVLKDMMGIGRKAEGWDTLDRNLGSFAHMAAVAVVGCGFCLDLAYFTAHNTGLDVEKAREVPRWRQSKVFTPLERRVMEYAEAMSMTPPAVTDEMVGPLLAELGAPALIELTARVALGNSGARMNVALGIRSQEFSATCGLMPLATPLAGVASTP